MLRPATPLTILFFIAFALLLLSTISTPVVKQIPLGKWHDHTFGVFGYCGPGYCTPAQIGYLPTNITEGSSVPLPSNTRHSLSSILVVHPIAAFMTLICTILSGASHFRGPAHSPRYLLGLLILTFPTLLITLLAFLVDVLLFIPHLQWGGWIVLAATIIIVMCSVLTCAIRRTLVSRKARKERIEKNAEMNGETYYANRVADQEAYATQQTYARAESPPPIDNNGMNGGLGDTKGANAASYEYGMPRASNEERVPLRHQAASMRSFNSNNGNNVVTRDTASESGRIMGPMAAGAAYGRDGMREGERSPVSPMDDDPYAARRHPSSSRGYRGPRGPMPPPGRGGSSRMYGGRGGHIPGYFPPPKGSRTYPPPPAGYPPRGYPPPRGPRGGYMRGGPRGPPPPGWSADGAPVMAAGMPGPSRGRPPGYQNEYYENDDYYRQASFDYPSRSHPGSARPSGERPRVPGGWPSADDVIQDYEYDRGVEERPIDPEPQRRRSPGPPSAPGYERSRSTGSRRGDYEVQPSIDRQPSGTRDPSSFGFSGRQPSPAQSSRQHSPPPPMPSLARGDLPGMAIEMDAHSGSPAPNQQNFEAGDGVDQSTGTYLARSAWQAEPEPLGGNGYVQSTNDAPVELPGHAMSSSVSEKGHRPRKSSDAYYEDVAPRFSSEEGPATQPIARNELPLPVPTSLMPGRPDDRITSSIYSDPVEDRIDSRSPAYSENSDFTSISQRGVNPAWQPPPGTKAAKWRANETILNENPEFTVPGAESRIPRGSQDGGPRGHVKGMSGTHRYPV